MKKHGFFSEGTAKTKWIGLQNSIMLLPPNAKPESFKLNFLTAESHRIISYEKLNE